MLQVQIHPVAQTQDQLVEEQPPKKLHQYIFLLQHIVVPFLGYKDIYMTARNAGIC